MYCKNRKNKRNKKPQLKELKQNKKEVELATKETVKTYKWVKRHNKEDDKFKKYIFTKIYKHFSEKWIFELCGPSLVQRLAIFCIGVMWQITDYSGFFFHKMSYKKYFLYFLYFLNCIQLFVFSCYIAIITMPKMVSILGIID